MSWKIKKWIPLSILDILAYALLHLNTFCPLVIHLSGGVNSILPCFSSLSIVAVSVPFPEAQNRKGTESGLVQAGPSWSKNLFKPVGWLFAPQRAPVGRFFVKKWVDYLHPSGPQCKPVGPSGWFLCKPVCLSGWWARERVVLCSCHSMTKNPTPDFLVNWKKNWKMGNFKCGEVRDQTKT